MIRIVSRASRSSYGCHREANVRRATDKRPKEEFQLGPLMFPRPSVSRGGPDKGHDEVSGGGFARWKMKFSATKRAESVCVCRTLDRNFLGDASTRNSAATLRITLHEPPPGSRPCFYWTLADYARGTRRTISMPPAWSVSIVRVDALERDESPLTSCHARREFFVPRW